MKKCLLLVLLLVAMALPVASVPATNAAGQSGDPAGLLPDGSALIKVDVQKITGSDLWATLSSQGKSKSFIDNLQADLIGLGLNLSDIKSVGVSVPTTGMKDLSAIVMGSFDQQSLLNALRADPKIKLSSVKYKGIDVYAAEHASKSGAKQTSYFAFLDTGVAATGSEPGIKSALDVRAGDKPAISSNSKITAPMGETDGGAAIRFVLLPGAGGGMLNSVGGGMIPLPDFSSVNVILGSASVGSGLDFSAVLRNDTPDHAKAVANQLNSLFSMAKGFLTGSTDPKMAPIADAVKTVTINQDGNDVKIGGSVSKELLSRVIR